MKWRLLTVSGIIFCLSPSSFSQTYPKAEEKSSPEVFEIYKNSEVSSKGLSQEQQKQLESKIAQTLKHLYEIPRKKGDFLFPKNALMKRLKPAKSFDEAVQILEKAEKDAVSSTGTTNVTKVEENLQTQKKETQAFMLTKQIDEDTDRVMKDALILGNTHLTQEDQQEARTKVREIIEKYHKKEMPNLTGQDPIHSISEFLKLPTSRQDIDDRLARFMRDIQKFTEKYVAAAKELDKKTPDVAPINTQISLEDKVMILNPANVTSLITDLKSPRAQMQLKLKDPEQIDRFSALVASPASGLMIVPVGKETVEQQVNLKVFAVENYRGKDALLKKSIKIAYYKFFVFPDQAREFQHLADEHYTFWYLQGKFFALPQNPSEPAYSLSQSKSKFTGDVIRELVQAMSTVK